MASRLVRFTSLVVLLLVAALVLAQSASDLLAKAQEAYNKKEYAKSAELYMQAHKAKANPTALYNAACSYALDGQKEKAFEILDQLLRVGYASGGHLQEDPDFASLHSDPRWAKLKAGFDENDKKNPIKRWVKPYKILPAPADAAPFEAKLNGGSSAVYLEGDVLTFLHRSVAKMVQLSGGIQEPMMQVGDSSIWIAQVQMKGWENAIVSYFFLEGSHPPQKMEVWRGENAPELPERTSELKGKLIERKVKSDALGEERSILIYLPPNAGRDIPAFFLADGGVARTYAASLEPLILAGKVRPCAIVGIESGGYRGDRSAGYDPTKDFRAKEYVNGEDEEWFAKHLKFFTEEVPALVAREYGISSRGEDRCIGGFSNGGAFAAAVAFRRPDLFGAAMPLSLGVPPNVPMPEKLPSMFFAAGSLESFSMRTEDVYRQVKAKFPSAKFELYVAGHDPTMWELAFLNFAPQVFPPR